LDLLEDLDGEFSRGRNDYGADAFLLFEVRQAVDEGEAKGEGLAAACLGDADQVAGGQEVRPRGGLDGRGLLELGEEGGVAGQDLGWELVEAQDGAQAGALGVGDGHVLRLEVRIDFCLGQSRQRGGLLVSA